MRTSPITLATACVAAATLAIPTLAQGTYTELGAGSSDAVSQDGTTIVGLGFDGPTVWAGGSATLIPGQDATGVSSDGGIVLVEAVNPDNEKLEAALWSGTTLQFLGGLPGQTGCDANLSNPYDLSDGGDVAVGLGWEGCAGRAFKWTPGDGMVALPQIGPNSARANTVSGDGTHIGGWDEAVTGPRRASIWFPDGSESLPLEGTPDNDEGLGETWGFSRDGTYACGQGPESWIWNEEDGATYLGKIEPFDFFDVFIMFAITDDGTCAVGAQGSNFGTPFRATIWTEEGGLQLLVDFLTEKGVELPDGVNLSLATDITADGTVICGTGGDIFSQVAWRVDLTEPECFLVIGTDAGNTEFNPGLYNWETQVGDIEDYYAVLLDDIPEFTLPQAMKVRGQSQGTGMTGMTPDLDPFAGLPDWMGNGHFTVQIVMWNPTAFPELPEQFTYGLAVSVSPNGQVYSQPYGGGTGMEIWTEVTTNANGEQVLTFPFSIPGIN